MLLKDKKVAIIGGGPGGLMLARLLQQQGVDVKVYERDADQFVRQQGSTLDLHRDTGLKAMEAAGLMNEFKKHYRPGADKSVIVNGNMDILYNEHEEKSEKDFGDEYFRPEIDRGPLRDLLISSIKKENIVWNSKFIALKASGSGWEIQFENRLSEYADVVVAADGANSKLRKYITDISPVYSGVTSIDGSIHHAALHVPEIWKLTNGASLFALQKGKTILCKAKGDGTLSFLVGLKTPENWLKNSGIDPTNRISIAEWFANEFRDWNDGWQELFATDDAVFVPRVWYHFPLDQHWNSLPNLTMIGDAAHRIPPFAGEGANQALADALDLYESLCCEELETILQAITSFEQKMLKRSAVITEDTLQNTEGLHSENNLQFLTGFFGNADPQ